MGRDPTDWKSMPTIGAGVREIRIRDLTGAYRVIDVATFVDALHAAPRTREEDAEDRRRDLELAAARLRHLGRESE
jgi:phage-related protein